MSNGLNCHNLKVCGGLSVTLETLEAKVKIDRYLKGIKCNFPFLFQMTCYDSEKL
jgi:hypothetical protein